MPATKRAAVTGGAGRLGSALVRTLLHDGWQVRVLEPGSHALPSLEGLDIELRRGSVLSREDTLKLAHGCDAVFNLAAKIDLAPDRDGSVRAVNIMGALNVARGCLRHGVRLVHCSSHHALHRHPVSEPLHEGKPLALEERCDYHRSKAVAEHRLLQLSRDGLDVVVASPGTIIGPYDFGPGIFGKALIDLCSGRIPVLLDVVSDYVDCRDVATGLVSMVERGRSGERYLLTGEALTMGEMASILERISGKPMPKLSLPLWVAWLGLPAARLAGLVTGQPPLLSAGMLRASVSNKVVVHDKARLELGFSPRSVEAALKDELAFYRERGWLD